MPDHKRVAPREKERPAALGLVSTTGVSLPVDLVQRAVRRLGWLALGFAVSALFVYVVGAVIQPGWIDPARAGSLYLISTVCAVVLGLLVFGLAWSRKLPPLLMLDLGLVFEVVGAFLISVSENSVRWPPDEVIRGHSSVSVWVALFVLAVPATLGKTTLAAMASAFMGPAGLAVHVVTGGVPSPPPSIWVLLFFPTFMMAVWCIALSRFIYNLGAQVGKAKEMGSYQLIEMLGSGGMGEVWRARHRMLARSAAIKLIRREALSGASEQDLVAAQRRFEREAQATAQLHSPHTVALYDYGVSEDGNFFYVMELLDGVDLENLVSRFGPQPAARVVHLLRQICSSLSEAHAAGLVHRDIKPRNIFVCRLGFEYDFVKVLDFGLVKFHGGEPRSQLTSEGLAAGTPAYMAPEVALGNQELDGRTDLYAVGCVGYWLLTGQLVFEATTPVAMALAHVQQAPIPPSRRSEIEIPASLEKVILRCLAKDPASRPQSARELAEMLAACELPEPWTPPRAERWWQAHVPPGAMQAGAAAVGDAASTASTATTFDPARRE